VGAFDRLSPALRYQIVNALGWSELRTVQQQTIQAVLDGANCVVLAPTAGGKTEASFFPLLSMMDMEDWAPCSVLYLAPIRALLNNQEARLQSLTGLLGRRAFKWHGDVGASARKRFLREPTDVLATTPESLEAMLMSRTVPGKALLRNIRAVVIDEVHSFAAGDRGAHLVALLERITRLVGRDVQRIGLSATVGDPEVIVEWLSGSSDRERLVVNPGGTGLEPEIKLDFVGDLENAALVIDKLYPGTRRLVFVDSRRRVEQLGDLLNRRGVDVYVSHSSLSVSDRRAAETAFEQGQNCVIVATSALELGIDVGDLEHVMQIDCPSTVSSFLQRMGRTGRRAGQRANCTFLATSEEAALQTAALLRLHQRGFVEPTAPSNRAAHVLAHQLIALGIQQSGVAADAWWSWLQGTKAFSGLTAEERSSLLTHMIDEEILFFADARLSLGQRGERLYAGRNFMELFAVFSAPPVLKVMHGNQDVGTVDAWFVQSDDRKPLAFVLGGRAWQVVRVDWRRGTCAVKPADAGTYPRWMGRPVLLNSELCQAMREVLTGDGHDDTWSRRARTVIDELRESYDFLDDDSRPLVSEPTKVRWWTFAGGRANGLLAAMLEKELGEKVTANNLCVTFSKGAASSDVAIQRAIRGLEAPGQLTWATAREHASEVARGRVSKFQPCLPEALERDLLARHLLDVDGALAAVGSGAQLSEVVVERAEDSSRLATADVTLGPRRLVPLDSTRVRTRAPTKPRLAVRWVETPEALAAVVDELSAESVLGLDVETTLRDHRLCLAQIACPRFTALIDACVLDDLSPLAGLMASRSIVKVAHNASFEKRVLKAAGLELGAVFDTLTASRALRGHRILGGHSLGSVCERELDRVLDKGEQTSDWTRRPLSARQVAYAALDAEVMLELYEVFSADGNASQLQLIDDPS
jgi:ATP-dependent helicase Lhr and Lhr-like helicase